MNHIERPYGNLKDKIIFLCLLILTVTGCIEDQTLITEISNEEISICLNVKENVPYIESIYTIEKDDRRYFDKSSGGLLRSWVSENLIHSNKSWSCPGWQVREDSIFIRAMAPIILDGVLLEYHVDLVRGSPYFRQYFSIENNRRDPIRVPEFPILMSSYGINDTTAILRWWEALGYKPHEETISIDTEIILRSKIHSSANYGQTPGNVPYWLVRDERGTLYHAIAWSGGWQANFDKTRQGLNTEVFLNRMETQLDLKPGESVKGPEVYIMATKHTDDMLGRKAWFDIRKDMAARLYPQPEMGYPFIYNHWYSVEFSIDETFIRNQIEPIKKYDFDVFMIDAGWYKEVGAWTPDPNKFSPGSFKGAIKDLKANGVTVGLWSCPQLKTLKSDVFPPEIDRPGLHVGFMNAWLIDFTGTDFTHWLSMHIDTLVNHHGAGWWKFDQDFFGTHSHHGKIRNVNSLQEGIGFVRRTYPDLIIEACMSGGKMINEFTDMVSQIHWIRDGARSGYMHAISNIHEAMGAIEFLDPIKVQRWNNRLDEVGLSDSEVLKLYLRSCMLGTWGISTDLDKLNPQYFKIIEKERGNYRKINELKKYNLYKNEVPQEYSGNVYAIYYNEDFTEAALLLYRMFKDENPVNRTIQTSLVPGKYTILDADKNSEIISRGNVLNIQLDGNQLSNIYFIKKLK